MIELGILCAVTLLALFAEAYLNRLEIRRIRAEFQEERQILLNRIQDPKYKPPITPSEKQANRDELRQLADEAEQYGLVGKIVE